ncbi:ABC transporter ATP-binding protein [Treponema sp. UBA3813]|uniref:ABC transporter ATP-binding protein n=1 Tax=Treponema sp. UBA3813 TaxID=1947715 RepID=UPI0025E31614|nr:ABC transporter ATP-binding protein [Treponema sp. UBA3813]
MLFQINHLSAEFSSRKKKIPILNDVSLSVDEGEFVALVGESGSGKTMTSLSAMHLLPEQIKITGGEIFFGGRKISKLSDDDFRKISGKEISMIFQEPMTSLNPLIKIGRQIEESGLVHGLSKEEARLRSEELARLTGLKDTERIFQSFPHELSGGMKQRVMIASALMNNPRLLIADEPTTALDVLTQEEIISILKNLRAEKKISMLLITHDFSVVRKLCSRVYIMYKGKIVESASTEEIFKNPKHEYTRALIEAIPSLQKRDKKLPVFDAFIRDSQLNSEGR